MYVPEAYSQGPDPFRARQMPQPVANRREIRASRGQVFAAADRALKSGRRPTQDGIRTDLGGGSLNSINTYLNEWYQDLGTRLSRSEEPVRGVPSEASDLLLQLWRLAIKTTGAAKATDAESEELRIMGSQRDAAMAQASALQTLNAELTRHRTTAERALSEARALLIRREAALEEERQARTRTEQELVRCKVAQEIAYAGRLSFRPKGPPKLFKRSGGPTRSKQVAKAVQIAVRKALRTVERPTTSRKRIRRAAAGTAKRKRSVSVAKAVRRGIRRR